MNEYYIIRAIMEQRLREAEHERLAREVVRHQKATARTADPTPRRHVRLPVLARFRRAFG